jgi:putative ABC transport system substrate-binding protein
MEDRSANGQLERLGNLASELARLPVDLFVVGGDAPILAAMRASDTIPIVMTLAADPIRSGFIQSLARPGGNVTGMSALASDMAGKRLELLKEAVPRAQRVAVLWNSDNPSKVAEWKDTQEAAGTVGLALRSVEARSRDELEVALAAIGKDLPDALLTFTDGLTIGLRQRIGSFALASRLPMISEIHEFAEAGGLATYGASRADCGDARPPMSTRSRAGQSPAIFRSSSRPGSNWSSISTPPRRSVLRCRRCSSRAPTR